MTPQIHSDPSLRLGYSTRTKTSVAAAASLGWLLTYLILIGDASLIAVVPATLALVSTAMLAITFRSGFTIDNASLRHTTWRGHKDYPRAEFLAAESIEEKPGQRGLLLRFQSGVVLLSDAKGCANPEVAREFLNRNWSISSAHHRAPAGPVESSIELEYEPMHLSLLAFATVALALIASLGPMFWAAAILAVLSGRAFYLVASCRHIAANADGIVISRALRPKLSLGWDKISSVRYWHSLAHGGVILSDGQNTIRIYRWIRNYPRLNRLLQDRVPATSLAVQHTLPWTISMNRRRQSSLVVLVITAGISLWIAAQGAWPAALLFFAIPALTFAFTVVSSDRRIEITRDRIRVYEKRSFQPTTHDYRREDLEDMRIGRQLTAGGLWLNFGAERLEIANLDSQCAPEEILAVLRREWQTQSSATAPAELHSLNSSLELEAGLERRERLSVHPVDL